MTMNSNTLSPEYTYTSTAKPRFFLAEAECDADYDMDGFPDEDECNTGIPLFIKKGREEMKADKDADGVPDNSQENIAKSNEVNSENLKPDDKGQIIFIVLAALTILGLVCWGIQNQLDGSDSFFEELN